MGDLLSTPTAMPMPSPGFMKRIIATLLVSEGAKIGSVELDLLVPCMAFYFLYFLLN